MTENLRTTIQDDRAVMADTDSTNDEVVRAGIDLSISKSLLRRGVEEI